MTAGSALRTTSLRRRLVVSTLVAVLLVLAGAVAATDVLVGKQLTSTAASRLTDNADAAQAALDAGSDPAAVVGAAQGEGVTAQLTTSDGRVYGDRDLTAAPVSPPVPAPPPTPVPTLAQTPVPTPPASPPDPPPIAEPDRQVKSIALSDGSTLTVAVDTASISAVRMQLRTVLIAVFAAASLLVALLVALSVGQALAPLDRMTELARKITDGNRGGRLNPARTDTEIGRTADAFDTMLDSLEEAERNERAAFVRNRQFFDDAAHELRTPIAGVRAAAEALIGTGPEATAESREHLEVLVVRESRRASRLIDDLLALARIDEGIDIAGEPVDVRALVDADAARLRVAAPGREVETSGAESAVIWADPLRVAQVLANLTNNAHAYSPPDGVVFVDVSQVDGNILVSVRDQGIGVPAEERDHIFERMVRLDEARTVGQGGSGLGLPIARELARAHGGDVLCRGNEPEPGCTFVLRLPTGELLQH